MKMGALAATGRLKKISRLKNDRKMFVRGFASTRTEMVTLPNLF